MITIRKNMYTREELIVMLELFDEMHTMFRTIYCDDILCEKCKYKHVCYAIRNASGYLHEEIDPTIERQCRG